MTGRNFFSANKPQPPWPRKGHEGSTDMRLPPLCLTKLSSSASRRDFRSNATKALFCFGEIRISELRVCFINHKHERRRVAVRTGRIAVLEEHASLPPRPAFE